MTILLLAGSPSAPSRSTRLLHHVGDKLAQLGHRHARLEVRDLPGQAILRADWNNAEIKAALSTVEEASAVVVATPVYKAAYSGILKAFLDLLPQFGLTNKLVLPPVASRTCWRWTTPCVRCCPRSIPSTSCPASTPPKPR